MQSSYKKHFQLIVFRKLWGWKLEKSYTEKYTCHLGLHQRSPWNMNGKENTQDVIVVQDETQTSRSQRISVNSFKEELCSSDKSGQLDITQDVINVQTCSSEDNKSLNVEQTHDRSLQLDIHTVAIQDDPEVFHEAKTLNTDNETIRERVEEDMDFKFQDYHILLWSKRTVPAFENWFRRSRTIRIDMLFNETYNRVNHWIPSVKNQNKWFMKFGTSNCVNYSIRNAKHSARYAYHTGTSASSTARAATSCVKAVKKIRNSSSTRWTSFPFLTTT